MAMNLNQSHPTANSASAAVRAAMAKEAGARRADSSPSAPGSRTSSGMGLPCSKCHLYYSANLDVCPTCKHNERVSAVAPKIAAKRVETGAAPVPDNAALEKEREEFLRQFKAQLREAHAEAADALEEVCKFEEHHAAETAPAEICTGCYERLQERLDVCEAALHMELKEAAQIVYDAVWADPSDPGKTYQNAASALLAELRKRAGITAVFSPFQPLTH
ncbi:MAG: hypothetical protein WAM79_04145 [Candidatus Sulfotelmatobacter sp.]